MNASFSKRFTAFIIDLFIVGIISGIITAFVPVSKNYESLNKKLTDVANEFSEKVISEKKEINMSEYEKYIDEVAPISYQMEKELFINSIIVIVIYILYYVIFQFKYNGQTLGKKFMKIKVKKDAGELTINDLLFRSLIINSILSSLISLILLFTTKNMNYLIANEIVSIIFGIAMITSGLMCVIRKDNKALQDVITKTVVVEVGE